ncbi:MAG: hypothetical protein LBV33_02605 [Lachnospiraceae bacterium]|jgi:hypothetical protein|nr:hypothetical protein [Lachnospiraceae bacterium]
MEGLLFPIIMLSLTLIGGGSLFLFFKNGPRGQNQIQENASIKTAQDFINVTDIRDKYLYTNDGLIFVYLRINAVSIDLYSNTEKNALIKTLTAELSDLRYPFKFMALSRPVDISPLITEMTDMLKDAEEKQKELLRQEIVQMGGYALSGEIVERQFYIALWGKQGEDEEPELSKQVSLLGEKFSMAGISTNVLSEKEIIRLLNLINNPAYTHLEDAEATASYPTLIPI